jgi:hypothetical protein
MVCVKITFFELNRKTRRSPAGSRKKNLALHLKIDEKWAPNSSTGDLQTTQLQKNISSDEQQTDK